MDLLRSVWPARWIPPFRRGDWVQEEIIETRAIRCGSYDQEKITGKIKSEFTDQRERKRYEIEFIDGDIWMMRVD